MNYKVFFFFQQINRMKLFLKWIFANMRTLNAFRLKWASKASNPFESNQERTDCDFIFSGFAFITNAWEESSSSQNAKKLLGYRCYWPVKILKDFIRGSFLSVEVSITHHTFCHYKFNCLCLSKVTLALAYMSKKCLV